MFIHTHSDVYASFSKVFEISAVIIVGSKN